ncbi:hypothetical protein B1A99_16495 [Cohnella sp. CIP 111063]|uniref:Ger(x)C family spore germination protein n=1 Tax=unclassified Cohnella TaxID=2636738 RepID=UPI000B8C65A9|nr:MULTISPECIES: Ger(x)C family spore germination protein [unclassified Cohnella]OXS57653.1 hypothetical protein B1A99_16495 [Cohnella sp. CIP 111063]PRX71038.1 spore germination protein [Cohnella sp. SGD-V74]
MSKLLRGLVAAASLILAAGCWDRVEIEDRGFVVGSAIDEGKDGAYELTFQYIVPSAMQGKSAGGGHPSAQSFQNVSSTAATLFKAARKMSNETSRPPYLEHNKIIIVSERLARAGKIQEVLDLFVRDPEMRRAAKLMISVGQAKKLLEIKPPIETLPVQYINSTSENPQKSESIVPATTMGHVHRFLLEEHSFAIPRITQTDSKVSLSGAAVFGSDKKMKGFLDGEETTGKNYFSGTIKAGAVEVEIEGKPLLFEVKRASRTLYANVSDPESPAFTVNVRIEGNVGETYSHVDLLDPQVIRMIENRVSDKIREIMYVVLEKLQKEYKADAIGLSDYLNENHYRVWKKIAADWDRGDHLFSKCKVDVKVHTRLRIIGAIERVQPEGE